MTTPIAAAVEPAPTGAYVLHENGRKIYVGPTDAGPNQRQVRDVGGGLFHHVGEAVRSAADGTVSVHWTYREEP